jgi:major membrane immunogen (membrane-anchored lipoprotein)
MTSIKNIAIICVAICMLIACGDSNENVKSNNGTGEKTMQDAIDSKDAVLMEIKDLESKVNTDSAFDRTRALRCLEYTKTITTNTPRIQ